MRLVVRADDADREPDHEEERHEHGAQCEPRLVALIILHAGVGWSVIAHAAPLFSSGAVGVAGFPLRDSSPSVRANTCRLVMVRWRRPRPRNATAQLATADARFLNPVRKARWTTSH